ncbi:ABC transporter ATP-binding protein [Castellaniella sp. GW247-6E4]|uniref:ABC transporter ATP-binding protein n=1 Tax=Castellaniella sp. GW247-6E4 TaxID=3140380 RepID=UPI0033148A41
MLLLDSVAKTVGGAHSRTVFRGLDLELRAGEYVAIMGESGVGKSTLLNLIAGLDRPDGGRIVLDGRDIHTLDDDEATRLRRGAMGFVFQAFHVLPHLSVAGNVELPLLLLGVGRREARARVQAALDDVGLGGRGDSLPRELSGGEMQRVAIARALVHRPSLILADEPTGNLDQGSAAQILSLLRGRIKAEGAQGAMGLLVTHSASAAASADRVLRLTAEGLAPLDPPTRR